MGEVAQGVFHQTEIIVTLDRLALCLFLLYKMIILSSIQNQIE